MSVTDRPFVGSWELNNREVIKHTPDALVYVNGDLAVPGCTTCNGRIDLQQFITSVSVDPSITPVASGNITLQIPRHYGDSLVRDGQFILSPGLEVHIYMRGYFPVKGAFSSLPDGSAYSTKEVADAVAGGTVYPYYLVFHGVMVDVSHEYNNGEHTVTINLADLLHFWQYQRMSTSGNQFGVRISHGKAQTTLMGNTFNGMTPHSIVYNLYRDTGGSAGGQEFALGSAQNTDAKSTAFQDGIWTMTMAYWAKRFNEKMNSLRMYGVDGTLYNAFQQSFISVKDVQEKLLDVRLAAKALQSPRETDPFLYLSRQFGVGSSSLIQSSSSADEVKAAAEGGSGDATINITEMQAFVQDMGAMGTANNFETQYETKLEIINKVCEITGFEFFQDVDGDFVFKPPFYNLDTKQSRAYVIKDIDIINFSTKEGEPEVTVIKATSGQFQNLSGTPAEGEWGNRAEFIDFKLAAKFGWRQQTFETSYITNPGSMLLACANRLSVLNAPVNSATLTIPLRPELRPGMPVYIEHIDCYYYIQSFNHQFQFGGQCVTSINLIAKRAKFYAPGKKPGDGRDPNVDDVDLSNMTLPGLPLTVTKEDSSHFVGFPNVVMAYDPTLVNPLFGFVPDPALMDDWKNDAGVDRLIRAAKDEKILAYDGANATGSTEKEKMENGPWKLVAGAEGEQDITIPNAKALYESAKTYRDAYSSLRKGGDEAKAAQAQIDQFAADSSNIFAQVAKRTQSAMQKNRPDQAGTLNMLDMLNDMKAKFNPGAGLPGYYRYYSASHPDIEMQGARLLTAKTNGEPFTVGDVTMLVDSKQVLGFQAGTSELSFGWVDAGIPVMLPGATTWAATPTNEITMLMFQQHEVNGDTAQAQNVGLKLPVFNTKAIQKAIANVFGHLWDKTPDAANQDQVKMNQDLFDEFAKVTEEYMTTVGSTPNTPFSCEETVARAIASMGVAQVKAGTTKVEAPPAAQPFLFPIAGNPSITSDFSLSRFDPVYKKWQPHKGIDIAAAPGTAVLAAARGVVKETGTNSGMGNYIKLSHADGYETWYFHLSKVLRTKSGSSSPIAAGDVIGLSGSTGAVTGPHLHFELHKNGAAIDPVPFVAPGQATVDTGYVCTSSLGMVFGEVFAKNAESAYQNATGITVDADGNESEPDLLNADPQIQVSSSKKLREAYLKYTSSIADYDRFDTKMDAGSAGYVKYTNKEWVEKKAIYTPVFPVSDAEGYEVVGHFRYGRGLSIESGAAFEQLSTVDSLNGAPPESVEEFVGKVISTKSISGGFEASSDDTKAAIAMAVWGQDTINIGQIDGTRFEQKFTSRIASLNEYSHRVSVTNAAYSLADLGSVATKGVCACKGAEADVFLNGFDAYTDDFLGVYQGEQEDGVIPEEGGAVATKTNISPSVRISADEQPDDISRVLAENVAASVVPWQTSQDALRGTASSSSFGEFTDALTAFKDNFDITAEAAAFDESVSTADAALKKAGKTAKNIGK